MSTTSFDFTEATRELDHIIQGEDQFEAKAEAAIALGERELGVENVHLTRIDVDNDFWKSILSTDPKDGRFPAGVMLNLGDTYCGDTVKEGLQVLHGDEARPNGLGTYLGVRIGSGNDPYGTLCFVSEEERSSQFDPDEIAFAELIARRLENELLRELSMERVHRLEQFARTISHDLRNPLSVAMGHLELAEAETENDHLEAIDRSLDRMQTMIEEVLVWARESNTIDETEEVRLDAIAREAWDCVDTADATLDVIDDFAFQADHARALRLFENVIRNGIEHGGRNVTISIGRLDVPDGLYIADNGPGIPREKRDRIFDTGYSTKADGTGLGMSIVSAIAGAHGWSVDIAEADTGGLRIEVRDLVIDPSSS